MTEKTLDLNDHGAMEDYLVHFITAHVRGDKEPTPTEVMVGLGSIDGYKAILTNVITEAAPRAAMLMILGIPSGRIVDLSIFGIGEPRQGIEEGFSPGHNSQSTVNRLTKFYEDHKDAIREQSDQMLSNSAYTLACLHYWLNDVETARHYSEEAKRPDMTEEHASFDLLDGNILKYGRPAWARNGAIA